MFTSLFRKKTSSPLSERESPNEIGKNQSPPPPSNDKHALSNKPALNSRACKFFHQPRETTDRGNINGKASKRSEGKPSNQLFHFHSTQFPSHSLQLGTRVMHQFFRSFSRLMVKGARVYRAVRSRLFSRSIGGGEKRDDENRGQPWLRCRCFAHEFSLCRWCKLSRRSLPRMKFTVTYGVSLYNSDPMGR